MNLRRIDLEFERVRRVPKSMWYAPHYLARAVAGDLLLLGELDERTGGLLRLRKMPVFISLTPDQVWNGAEIPWPQPCGYMRSIRIVGDVVEVMTPTGEPPRPSTDPAAAPC